MTAAPFVEVKNLRRVFDVSKPWLNRVLEGGHLEFLKAVDGVTFGIATEVVTPPAAHCCVEVWMVSLYSKPDSLPSR